VGRVANPPQAASLPTATHMSGNNKVHGLVGQSPEIVSLRRLIEKASRIVLPVLLLGETGTGKEVVARAIHNANPRGNFVPIDCGALVGTLMESELFGHVKGSFSGAAADKKGLVELADGGTAFFDEIGDLPLEFQVKLLRLIQESEFRPVGSLHWRKVDLRIIAATHRDLKAEVAATRFRQDLYYRLNVFAVRLPPLRDRKQDIPLLVEHFLEAGRISGFLPSPETMQTLLSYDWPGNVRELKHCIERMAALHSDGALQSMDLPSALQYHRAANGLHRLDEAVTELPEFTPSRRIPMIAAPVISIPESQRQAIAAALAATGGNRGEAARKLGIGRTTLYRKMKAYRID
jgi:transcriptional regulator with GAF, ATPase, and Fis domain